jgi:hypothetical protein
MSQETNRNAAAEATSKPDFAACCQEMAGAMSDCGPTMKRMMAGCGPMIERMKAACGEISQQPGPVAGDTDKADA